jgi:hypothetical protein
MKKSVAERDLEDEDWGAEDRGTPSEWGELDLQIG